MLRSVITCFIGMAMAATVNAQTMTLSTGSSDYQITNVFGDVDFFSIDVEIDAPLAPGAYVNPAIVAVNYQVTGAPGAGSPSGFTFFDLRRSISGPDFYAQGSSLSFEIAPSAVLDDGVQAIELVGAGLILTFNGREVDNGRFHPALLELDANGTGRIQNSDNIPTLNPLLQVNFGEEYITDLAFDPGNTTVIIDTPPASGGGSSGAVSPLGLVVLILTAAYAVNRRLRRTAVR